jgi:gliding motility-associated lipoprotein GldD
MKKIKIASVLIIIIITSCKSGLKSNPLPKAFSKMDVTNYSFINFKDSCKNFSFRIPKDLEIKPNEIGTACDINLYYPKHNATIYLTYVETNPEEMLKWKELVRSEVFKHKDRATNIDESSSTNPNGLNYITYNIEGDAASNFSFAITNDSTKLLRGGLLFWVKPNYDSIQPVINKIKIDTDTLLNSFEFLPA